MKLAFPQTTGLAVCLFVITVVLLVFVEAILGPRINVLVLAHPRHLFKKETSSGPLHEVTAINRYVQIMAFAVAFNICFHDSFFLYPPIRPRFSTKKRPS